MMEEVVGEIEEMEEKGINERTCIRYRQNNTDFLFRESINW
jgi:hypothetical protein